MNANFRTYNLSVLLYRECVGSVREVQSVLDLANAKDDIVILADKTAAHLYKLIQFLS